MSREGKCGRKSLPTKKQMNTKSSIARSNEYGNCSFALLSGWYSTCGSGGAH